MGASTPEVEGKKEADDTAGKWWKAVAKYVVAPGLFLLSIALVLEVLDAPYSIRSIDVPEELSKAGLSGESVAGVIRDRVANISARGRTATAPVFNIKAKGSEESQVDINIKGTDLSVRGLAAEIAYTLGISPLEVEGSIWYIPTTRVKEIETAKEKNKGKEEEGKQVTPAPLYHLSLRDSKGGGRPLFDAEGDLDGLLTDAAIAILGAIDPVKSANYLRFGDHTQRLEAAAMVQEGVRRGKRHDSSFWNHLGWHWDAEYPRALLVKAYVLSSNGLYRAALQAFDEARLAYIQAGDPEKARYAADGKAVASMEEAANTDSDNPLKEVDSYIKAADEPEYDSAEFHKAEFLAFKAERKLRKERCGAIKDFDTADEAYDKFEKTHGEFTISFVTHGKMLLTLATFLHFGGQRSDACVRDLSRDQRDVARLYEKTDKVLRQAIEADGSSAEAWLQLGILEYQSQIDEPEWHPKDHGSPRLLDEAIDRLSRAVYLDPENAYADYRLADTIKARLALTPAEHNEDYVRRGRDAACHGYAIATGQRRSDLESLAREFIGNDPVFCPQLPKRIPRQDDNWFMLEP
jgi:hypothetical protein